MTGDGLVVNEQHTASSSRVGAFIEADATEATFLVDWPVPSLAWSPRDPKKASDINVRLRMPNGKLLHPFDPSVRRLEGTSPPTWVTALREPAYRLARRLGRRTH